ncbi:MAG: hypothetical protein V7K64_30235 [Nostoc sp.]|uniref:hypothetical protein n=1 Tax=unclassified Nostoc TaxID=2593658 RepID=UPI001DD14D6C|nr:hypothetical protein [Nostoc sp. JL34]MBN3881556.1 hypothetical protein [Nostoc sp. JL34]
MDTSVLTHLSYAHVTGGLHKRPERSVEVCKLPQQIISITSKQINPLHGMLVDD